MQRVLTIYKDTIWLNPQPESVWDYHESIRVTREIIGERLRARAEDLRRSRLGGVGGERLPAG